MFGIGTWELVIILVVVLLIFGPKRLPKMARDIGRAFHEFRRQIDGAKDAGLDDTEKGDKAESEKVDSSQSS